jgi:uncharacterized membrane protein
MAYGSLKAEPSPEQVGKVLPALFGGDVALAIRSLAATSWSGMASIGGT